MRVVISQFLIFCILVQTNFIAYGQVRTDGTTSTTVTQAANGVDVVNIANANSRGLSHNKYIDFNVANKGLILNNSKTVSRSQLGGVINGNSGLRNQAKLILNEVTSSNRSKLNGYIEVHGQSADVIIANPNGISCNGCGFINTPSATLTTGKPIVNGGELQRFDVNDGKVTIGELGLDATRADYFDIISRSVEVNGDIHAKNKLQVITGRNDVDFKTKVATKKADDGSAKPEFSIDSSALGGMYAGAISLVGTEDGVGVKAPENTVASLGDFNITADGKIIVNNATATGAIDIKAREVELNKTAYAVKKIKLDASKVTLKKEALVASRDLVEIKSTELALDEDSILSSNMNTDGTLNQTGELVIESQAFDLGNSAQVLTGKGDIKSSSINLAQDSRIESTELSLEATDLNLEKDSILNSQNAHLKVSNLNLNDEAIIYGKTKVDLDNLNLNGNKLITDSTDLNFSKDTVLVDGKIESHGDLNINVVGNLESNIEIEANQLNIDSTEDITVNNFLTGYTGVSLKGTNITIESPSESSILSYGDILLDAENKVLNKGKVESGANLYVIADNEISNEGGFLYGKDSVNLAANNKIYNGTLSDIISDGDISFGGADQDKVDLFDNHGGNIESFYGSISGKAIKFQNSSVGFQKTNRVFRARRQTGGNEIIQTTYQYQAFQPDGQPACSVILLNKCRIITEFSFANVSSYNSRGWIYRKTGVTGQAEKWPHQFTKHETTWKEEQINLANFHQGKILAGTDINIEADEFINDKSLIAATRDVNLTGGTFNNIAGTLVERTDIEVLMERRERDCNLGGCEWKHFYYRQDPADRVTSEMLFTTIEAGRAINNSMTTIENGKVFEGGTSIVAPDVVLTQIKNQSGRVNLGAIQGRTNLFQTNPDITSGFLIETDSKFINLDNFFSSDYFLDQVFEEGITDPDTFHRRRYGDAYVEDRLVRDQLFDLTGRYTFDEYLDPQDQMRALYDNALDAQKELNLTFGVSLTREQVSNLTSDIIWLETQTINGHDVLVPKVYLSQLTLDNLDSRGANIIASEVNLSSGVLLNTGSIQGRKKLNIDTGSLYNLGGRIAGGDVRIKADEILNRRLTETVERDQDQEKEVYDFFTGEKKLVKTLKNQGSYTRIGNESIIESTGNMNIETTGDINNVGGDIRAGGDLNIQAAGEVTSVSITDQESWDYKQGDYEDKISSVTHIKSGISAGGSLNLSGKKINLVGTDLEAGEDMTLIAKEGVTIESVQDQYNRSKKEKESGGSFFSGSKKTTIEEYKLTTNESLLKAGGKLKIVTDTEDITLQAVNPDADSYELIVKDDEGEINLRSNKDVDFKQVKTEQSGALWFKNVDKGHHKEKVKGVIFNTKEDTEIILQARNINIDILEHGSAEQGITEIAEKMPELAWLKNLKNDPNVNWSEIEAIHDEWNDTTQGLSQVGMLLVTIAVAIAAGPAAGALGSAVSGAGAVASAATGAALAAGATTAGAAMAAAAAVAAKVSLLSTAMGAMAAAGFSTIVTQASVSLINNQGNIGNVMNELTSSDSLRGLAVSMATAGAMKGIGSAAGWSDQVRNANQVSFTEKATQGAIRAGTGAFVRAGAGSLLNRESFSDSLVSNLENAGIGLAGELVANEIGDQYAIERRDDGGLSFGEYIAHKAAHGVLGCAMGAASGGNCAGGAIGSVTAEVVGEIIVNRQVSERLDESLENGTLTRQELRRDVENYVHDRMTTTTGVSTAIGIIAAELLGEDVNSANLAGRNSVENNLGTGNFATEQRILEAQVSFAQENPKAHIALMAGALVGAGVITVAGSASALVLAEEMLAAGITYSQLMTDGMSKFISQAPKSFYNTLSKIGQSDLGRAAVGILKAKAVTGAAYVAGEQTANTIAAIRGEEYLQGETLQEKSFNRSLPVYKTLVGTTAVTVGAPLGIALGIESAPLIYQGAAGCAVYQETCDAITEFGQGFAEGITGGESIPSGGPADMGWSELGKKVGEELESVLHE